MATTGSIHHPPPPLEEPVRQRYAVNGTTCDRCQRAITAELGAIAGVVAVEVDVTTGAVTVDSIVPLERTAVAAAVYDAGYDLAP